MKSRFNLLQKMCASLCVLGAVMVLFIGCGGSASETVTVTINYYLNQSAGEQPVKTEVLTSSKALNYPSVSAYTKDGLQYNFLYWSTDKNATSAARTEKEFDGNIDFSVTQTINLYAIYSSGVAIHKVTFYKDNLTEVIKNVEHGSPIPVLSYEEKALTGNHFLYWSKSRDSLAAATVYDVTTPITEDTTIYGVYAPSLSLRWTGLNGYEAGQLKVYLETSTYASKFKNGDVAGITVTAKKGGVEQDVEVKYIRISRTLDIYFTDFTESGLYTFTITNGYESVDLEYAKGDAANFTGIKVVTDDSYAKVTWARPAGTSNKDTITVTVKNGETVVCSNYVSGNYYYDKPVNSLEFYGLTNDIEYTFVVENTTKGTLLETLTATPKITVKKPDWVVAMYMDGDNNLNDQMFFDMNEVEFGLWNIRSSEGSEISKDGYDSVCAVALWDGYAGDRDVTPISSSKSGSYIYEFGAEESTFDAAKKTGNQVYGDKLSEYFVFNNIALSDTTKNLSYTAKDWLMDSSKNPSNIKKDTGGEVNMGSKQNLVNFLNWVKAHYEPNKGIILQFSDHGGGPRSAPVYIETPDGHNIKIGNSGRRALCWDENSSALFLKTQDVSAALSEAGFGTSNKLSMIIMDVCLGASIEDSYQFKDYAKYLVASPNNIPGLGMNYNKFMQSFTTGSTAESIGKQLVADYAYFYGGQMWNSMAQFMSTSSHTVNSVSDLTDQEYLLLEYLYGGFAGVPTLSCIDLGKIDDVTAALENVAAKLMTKTGDAYLVSFTDNKFTTLSQTETEYKLPLLTLVRSLAVSWGERLYYDTSLVYQGSFSWLYDIGTLADTLATFSTADYVGKYAQPDVTAAAVQLKAALQSAMVASWRDTIMTKNSVDYSPYGFYAATDGKTTADYTGHAYGLNIASYGIVVDDNNKLVVPGPVTNWYKTELEFGKNTNWPALLEALKAN